jgi:hypothetical protein
MFEWIAALLNQTDALQDRKVLVQRFARGFAIDGLEAHFDI